MGEFRQARVLRFGLLPRVRELGFQIHLRLTLRGELRAQNVQLAAGVVPFVEQSGDFIDGSGSFSGRSVQGGPHFFPFAQGVFFQFKARFAGGDRAIALLQRREKLPANVVHVVLLARQLALKRIELFVKKRGPHLGGHIVLGQGVLEALLGRFQNGQALQQGAEHGVVGIGPARIAHQIISDDSLFRSTMSPREAMSRVWEMILERASRIFTRGWGVLMASLNIF